ncbi:MAG: hypothetical protein JXI43_06480 [Tissierellales bacterium]|nr:hypothetical protein [Tissierellales bacterium]
MTKKFKSDYENMFFEKIVDWINGHWSGKHECPICKDTSWMAEPLPFAMNQHRGVSFYSSDKKLPLFPVTCTNCGYTLMFNAMITGILEEYENDFAKDLFIDE